MIAEELQIEAEETDVLSLRDRIILWATSCLGIVSVAWGLWCLGVALLV